MLSLLLLSSCASPQTVFEPVDVKVPVSLPCKAPAIENAPSQLQSLSPQTSLFEKTKAALIDLDQQKIYTIKLQAALTACQ